MIYTYINMLMNAITSRINKKTVLTAAVFFVLAVWGLTDVRHRAVIDPLNPEAHRTDFTVYTTAGSAMFAGLDPYTAANPRGWHYLYPPLFAILVSPLSGLDSQWQAVIWFFISLLMVWGCFAESRRIWKWLCSKDESAAEYGAAAYIFRLAGATALLPALNCLQRGQVGILLAYLLLLGFRVVLVNRSRWSALSGGVILALPIAIKVIPALPVAFLCVQLALAAALNRRKRVPARRAAGTAIGAAFGLLLYLLVIPGMIIGPAANAKHFQSWVSGVLLNEEGKSDEDFSVHTKRNQSLTNAVYRLGNWAAHVFGGAESDLLVEAEDARAALMYMDNEWVQKGLRVIQIGLMLLLLLTCWKLARRDDPWGTAIVFSLACLAMSAISPVFRGHYYVLWLPAAWIVPLYCRRTGRSRIALALSVTACGLVAVHYLFLDWAGRVGALGLGATIWYAACAIAVLNAKQASGAARLKTRIINPG